MALHIKKEKVGKEQAEESPLDAGVAGGLKSKLITPYDNESNRMVFIFRIWFDILYGVLTFLSFILEMFESFLKLLTQGYVTDIRNFQTFGKLLRTCWELLSKFGTMLFQEYILWVYCTIPVGFSLFWRFWNIAFQLLKLLS